MVVSREGACYVRRAGRMTCTRPAALNYTNPRAHWPKVSVAWGQAPMSMRALKGATQCNRGNPVKSLDSDAIGPLRGPIQFLLAFPRPHEVFDLCALGLRIVKAAGLVQAFSLLNFPRTPIIFYAHFEQCLPYNKTTGHLRGRLFCGEDKTLHLNFSKKQSLIIRYLAFGKVPKINSYCL